MADNRDTRSGKVKSERPQDTSAAIRANDADDTMSGGQDAARQPHGVAGRPRAGRTGLDGDDAPGEGVDSAEFPGTAAP